MRTQGSFLLTADMAEKAINMASPAIISAMETGILERHHLHIVVMDPGLRPHEATAGNEAILRERSFGNKEEWEWPYDEIAQAKTIASWRTGLPTHVICETMPYLLGKDDTLFWGSVVLDGIVVGASGVQPYFDEWASYLVAATCRALCIGAMQEILKNDTLSSFFREHAERSGEGA